MLTCSNPRCGVPLAPDGVCTRCTRPSTTVLPRSDAASVKQAPSGGGSGWGALLLAVLVVGGCSAATTSDGDSSASSTTSSGYSTSDAQWDDGYGAGAGSAILITANGLLNDYSNCDQFFSLMLADASNGMNSSERMAFVRGCTDFEPGS